MNRFAFALLLASLTVFATCQLETPFVVAQDKKKDKKGKAIEPLQTEGVKEDLARVLPAFDPGSHVKPISAMGFTKDKSKLITVGQDFTVMVWNVATGERLDVLRLPGYGREKGYDPGRWDVAAVSLDGTRVAIGGEAKSLSKEEARTGEPTRLILVDVPKRKVMPMPLPKNGGAVDALAFSPDGETLAIAMGKGRTKPSLLVVGGLTQRTANASGSLRTQDCPSIIPPHAHLISAMAFAPDGKQLLVGELGLGSVMRGSVTLWDVPAGAAPRLKDPKEFSVESQTNSLEWSPDGKQFARISAQRAKTELRGLEIRDLDGKVTKSWTLAALDLQTAQLHVVRYLNANTLLYVANGSIDVKGRSGHGTIAGILDVSAEKGKRLMATPDGIVAEPIGAVDPTTGIAAVTVSGNTEVLIGRPASGSLNVRCGNRTPIPFFVGWAKDPKKPGFAWSEERQSRMEEHKSSDLRFGFDLAKVEPLGEIRGTDYDAARWKLGNWAFQHATKAKKDENSKGQMELKQDGKVFSGFAFTQYMAHTLVPNGDKPPLVAYGHQNKGENERAYLFPADNKTRIAQFLPNATAFIDMASSADGRFLVASTGTPRIVVYRTDGSPYPLLSFAQLNGEWVCWTPEGYYAASPGGEKMFGWAVNNGPNELVTFYPAEKFARQFRRPDAIELAIEKGSVKEALLALNTVAPEVEQILPPSAKLDFVEQRGKVVKVKAVATSGAKDKPVLGMRVVLDGRPLSGGKGVWTPAAGKAAEDAFEIEIPAGLHELKVLARSQDGSATSDPVLVRGPKDPGKQPTLHRLCIGVNDYDDAGLKLGAATKDAEAMFAALAKFCVGTDNRFGTAKGEMILNKEATRDRVLKALADVRKTAKPGDLVVVFFAGHGVKQGDNYYLLTREADVNKDLKDKSLSGDDLRKGLAEVECPVLLILDACHSTASVRSFRSATDDLTRNLTDDEVGVTVMSAAMAHETAGASAEHGYFTAGILKGLQAGEGVPFDPYERQLYVHHLYSVAFSEVRRATNGKQNPFLNMPPTAPPLPVREVSVK